MGDSPATSTPYFSIIIPMFNRETLIGRALKSCLSQDFTDFEILVVDDGSSDGSVEAVRRFDDPRIRLLLHEKNRGVGPARNTAVRAARGEWIALNDSDDELAQGALSKIHARTREVGPEIDGIRFMCRMDSGRLSPDPPLEDEILDYEGYLRWIERYLGHPSEYRLVARRGTFQKVPFSEGRNQEACYHLDFARLYRFRSVPDVIMLYHQDAEMAISRCPTREYLLRSAPDSALELAEILKRHGEGLSRFAPRVFLDRIRGAATYHFLAGMRGAGLGYSLRYLRSNPLALKVWTVLVLGLVDRRLLANMKIRMRG